MQKPRIAVLMPVYNLERYVVRSVGSILNQTFEDFDFWIIDDGSTDGTFELLSEIKDSRIKLVQNPSNMGFVNTLNAALDCMDYEFIARMDGDDFAMPNRFEKQIQYMDENQGCVLVGSQSTWIKMDERGNVKDRTYWKYPVTDSAIRASLYWNASFVHSSVIFRRFSIGDLRYDPSFDVACEDWDLWTRLSLKGSLYNMDEPLMECLIRDDSMHRHNRSRTNQLYCRMMNSNFARLGLDQDMISVLTAEYCGCKLAVSFDSLRSAYMYLINLIDDVMVRREMAKICGLRFLGQIRDNDLGKLNALSVFLGPMSPGYAGLHKIKSYFFH